MRIALFATVAVAALALAVPARAQNNVKVGELRCAVASGLGMIITSSHSMGCTYTSAQGYSEQYTGTISKFGLDIGVTDHGVLAWAVFAPTEGVSRHALAGDYVGVGASATAGAGFGANALIGGSGRSIALQPFSVEAQTGLALSAGVASMTLR
jgi:hypothetical protein